MKSEISKLLITMPLPEK